MRLKNYVIGAALLGLVACNSDELDALKADLKDLQEQVGELEESQEAAMAAAIAALEQQIADLESANSDLTGELSDLTDRMQNEENAIYWGSLNSDVAYESMTEGNVVVMGNVVIRNADDLAKLQSIEVISGSLSVNGTALEALDLAALKTVGMLSIKENAAMTSLSLPSLIGVSNNFELEDNTLLASVELPSLTVVEASLILKNEMAGYEPDAAITDKDGIYNLASLYAVKGDLWVEHLVPMTELLAPALEEVGGSFTLYNNPSLTTVEFDVLKTVGEEFNFIFEGYTGELTALETFNDVTTIGGDITITLPSVTSLLAFESLEAVGVMSGGFGIGFGSSVTYKNITLQGFDGLELLEGFNNVEGAKITLKPRSLAESGAVLSAFEGLKEGDLYVQTYNNNDFDNAYSLTIGGFGEWTKGFVGIDVLNTSVAFSNADAFSKLDMASISGDFNPYTEGTAAVHVKLSKHVVEPTLDMCSINTFLNVTLPDAFYSEYVFQYDEFDFATETVEYIDGYPVPTTALDHTAALGEVVCQ
ncbi:hypothetical protein [Sediminitomix flava]|uniref:Receptor L domain-containing protein n=1 Tax=Sediminitomix flava TaxID=379075 RepID=A0A315ZGE8_SEDFL|nr:hypothetical protein [Sediminitomix flava]PWJ44666.1 hypothetical protein BC781_1011037 [Sediminitomix flava]